MALGIKIGVLRMEVTAGQRHCGKVIFNTFSITVAQRSSEFALLRALGATRSQVNRAVLTEAVAIGLIASLAGLAGGLGAAAAIRALFSGAGFNLSLCRARAFGRCRPDAR